MVTKTDPLDREIDISKLRRTNRPRGFYVDKITSDNKVFIKPEILEQFKSIEEINDVLEDYLNKKTA